MRINYAVNKFIIAPQLLSHSPSESPHTVAIVIASVVVFFGFSIGNFRIYLRFVC